MYHVKHFFFCIAIIGLFLGCLSMPSCSADINIKKNKPAYTSVNDTILIFTGFDWNAESKILNTYVLTDTTISTLEKKYIMQYIDLPRNTEQHDKKEIEHNYLLFSEYGVTGVPYIVMYTPAHDVYASCKLTDRSSDDLLHTIQKLSQKRHDVTAARKHMEEAQNIEKAVAIHTFLQTIQCADSSRYDTLRMQIPILDSKNKTGLTGRYLLITADIQAKECLRRNDFKNAVRLYKEAAENTMLSSKEKQLAWYLAGYTNTLLGTTKKDESIQYFTNALESLPNDSNIEFIAAMLKQLHSNP